MSETDSEPVALEWTPSQARALEKLNSTANVFITGGAGTGKSTVVRHFIQTKLAAAARIAPAPKKGVKNTPKKKTKRDELSLSTYDPMAKFAEAFPPSSSAPKISDGDRFKTSRSETKDLFSFDASEFSFEDNMGAKKSDSLSAIDRALEELTKPLFPSDAAANESAKTSLEFRLEETPERVAVLASTGTAAILLGGRTFHSFFGLGIMEGGAEQTLERATQHRGIIQRLKKTDTILIDEISMIGATEWITAEKIARKARNVSAPWGGLRVIAVGDFAQLPPVVRSFGGAPEEHKPWCFLTETWRNTEFETVNLKEIVRSHDESWNHILNELRWGDFNEDAAEVLMNRVRSVPLEFQGTRLFARRAQAEKLNHDRLETLSGSAREFNTLYMGKAQKIDDLKKNAPIPEVLILKIGALVMFRQNDPEYRFVNGTLGTIKKLPSTGGPSLPHETSAAGKIEIELFNGRTIELAQATFSMLDAEGEPLATASNYPLNLAWASTIHKAQGATLDRAHVDLRGVWEHGQSYVALSRVRSLADLTIEGLTPKAFRVDPAVKDFYRTLK